MVVFLSVFYSFSKELEFKGNILLGGNAVEKSYGLDSKTDEIVMEKQYGRSYLLADAILSTEKLTVGGKIYYRANGAYNHEDMAQKMEIKRAFVRVRPMGNNLLEVSGGKLYSYYLPGNFFHISETYTGASRWGESGVGVKSEFKGFTFGLALPVGETSSKIETYAKYKEFFALNGAVGYDFSKLNDSIPVKLNGMAGLRRTRTEWVVDKKTIVDIGYRNIFAASVNATPKFDGFIRRMNVTATYSYNAKPFVANTGFKPIINYNDDDLKWCHLASLNYVSYFGPVHFTFEGEVGRSIKKGYEYKYREFTEGNKIPVYAATQLLVPFTEIIAIKPRFMYYSAIDTKDSDKTRSTWELYPRLWLTYNQWTLSAGADFVKKQMKKDEWKWEWSIPFYVEYKIK